MVPVNAPYRTHVFVCTGGKVCPGQGSEALHRRLKEMVFEAGLGDEVRVNKSGCFAQCGHGPMVVVHPEGRWYAAVTERDAEALFASLREGAAPVERLLYAPGKPGKNVRPVGGSPGALPAAPGSGPSGNAP